MRLSLVSDASEPNFHAGRCYLPPWQQATDYERTDLCAFFRLEVPVGRVLFSMNYFDKILLNIEFRRVYESGTEGVFDDLMGCVNA